jgi:hypothetical protein
MTVEASWFSCLSEGVHPSAPQPVNPCKRGRGHARIRRKARKTWKTCRNNRAEQGRNRESGENRNHHRQRKMGDRHCERAARSNPGNQLWIASALGGLATTALMQKARRGFRPGLLRNFSDCTFLHESRNEGNGIFRGRRMRAGASWARTADLAERTREL